MSSNLSSNICFIILFIILNIGTIILDSLITNVSISLHYYRINLMCHTMGRRRHKCEDQNKILDTHIRVNSVVPLDREVFIFFKNKYLFILISIPSIELN